MEAGGPAALPDGGARAGCDFRGARLVYSVKTRTLYPHRRTETKSLQLTSRGCFRRRPHLASWHRLGDLAGRPPARHGFSITELLISVVVVSVGVLGFASAVSVTSLEMWFGNRDTEVALLVTDQLERLKATPPGELAAGQRIEGDYRLDWEVEGTEPRRVRLVARYPGRDGLGRADTLVTFISR